mgnify:CR=1 FL=1
MPRQTENLKSKWYAIHTYSGYEDAVALYLRQRIESLDMHDKIFEVVVPKEKKIKLRAGKKKEVEEKVYPGYVFVKMILTDDSWYVVRNTPKVTGFVGPDSTVPSPLPEEQVEELLKKMEQTPSFKLDLKVGDMVRIVDGPFKYHEGKIFQTDEKRGKVKVSIPIFGRETPVEVDFLQVKKI